MADLARTSRLGSMTSRAERPAAPGSLPPGEGRGEGVMGE